MTKPDGERISVLEIKVDDLKSTVTEISLDVKTIMALLGEKYMTKIDAKVELDALKRDVKNANNWRWVTHTASAVAGALLFYLITFLLTHQ